VRIVLSIASAVVLGAGTALAAPTPRPTPPAPAKAAADTPAVLFRDITKESGIKFVHHSAPEKKYIVESMSGGVVLFDFDKDDKLDVYFVDSLTVDTAKDVKAARSELYRGKGDGTFEDVSDRAGVAHPGWAMGACAADADGDGWTDLYVTALGPNRLYRNNHDGTFTEIAEKSGVTGGGWSAGCGFADYDRDGDLDLFVSRYVELDLDHLPEFGKGKTCEYRGIAVQCGPRGLPGSSDFLYRNEGNGKYTEVSTAAGVVDPKGYFGLGVAWVDFNDDGWPDLYVANDSTPSFLFMNQKNGTFKESGFPLGVAVSEDGAEQGGMGVAIADYDGSGRFSIVKTNFSEEYNNVYHNKGDHFTDDSFVTKTAAPSLPYVGWGVAFLDYDNDTRQDLLIVNGHVYPQLDKSRLGASAGYRQRRLLYHNNGDGTFDEVAERYGTVMTHERVSRGLAIGDINNDGRIDAIINDLDGAPQILLNEGKDPGNWLIVKLVGKGKNTSAVGAIVTVKTGTTVQKRLVQSGTSYISQDDMRQHVGLGGAKQADLVEVKWLDGTSSKLENVKPNQILEIRQP
jgi:enediyne biosynthesis protein E4